MAERGPVPGVGETFGGYAIESLLGRGGMGAVYLATHARLARKVALKVIAPELAHDEGFRARFLRESQLAASLEHPNVIPIYDAGEVDGTLFLAMRYVSGPSLQTLLRARGTISDRETLRLAEQIGGALDASHATGLVHRDVKPANILLSEGGDQAYLCDFGLAKQTTSHGVTQTGSFLGTVDYCAPEQIEGRGVDGRTDLYSLGAVLFHCLAGQPPYLRETDFAVLEAHLRDPPPALSTARAGLPATLDGVLATAMAKYPEVRYGSGAELAAAFAGALAGADGVGRATMAAPTVALPAPPENATVALHRPSRPRRRRLVFAAVVAALLGGGGIAAAIVATRASSTPTTTSSVTPKLRTFVDRIENVLSESADGRKQIVAALNAGFACRIPPRTAGRRIGSVGENRQSLLSQLLGLPAPTSQADRVVTQLQRGLQQSIEADRHYRDAFFSVTKPGCPIGSNGDFALARASDRRASAAKQRFLSIFNPLAERFGRRTWAAGDI
jgi:serine/threonine protein kinase